MAQWDIYQNGNQEVVVKAELPDIIRDDIDVTVDNGTLTIKGEKKVTVFSRSFTLAPAVDTAKVAAEYKDGVLTVRLPLREEAKPRQVKVDVAA
jgi:HSP20 family protein